MREKRVASWQDSNVESVSIADRLASAGVSLACPRCRGAVNPTTSGFSCSVCQSKYPVIEGLPDFRIEPDRFLTMEQDREKGIRVLEQGGGDFERTLDAYWAATAETDSGLAEAYKRRQLAEGAIGESEYAELVRCCGASLGPLLDTGCRLGGLVSHASSHRMAVGVDSAFRWLLVAKLRAQGTKAIFICANPEALPFAGGFETVHCSDLVEHLPNPGAALQECRRVLVGTGSALIASNNRYSLGPEPHSRLIGVGWLPRALQQPYVRWRTGRDYSRVRLPSPGDLRREVTVAGFHPEKVKSAPVQSGHLGGFERQIAGVYERARGWVPSAVAPRIQVIARP